MGGTESFASTEKYACFRLGIYFYFLCCFTVATALGTARVPTIESVRIGGFNVSAGRVIARISNYSGDGKICDDMFDDTEARVVCRQLGFSQGAARSLAQLQLPQDPSLPFIVDDVICQGTETSLRDCVYFAAASGINCGHDEDACVVCWNSDVTPIRVPPPPASATVSTPPARTTTGIIPHPAPRNCTGAARVRLIGKVEGVGFVQVQTDDGTFGFLCDDGWDLNAARVVCRELCYDTSLTKPGIPTREYAVNVSSPRFVMDDVNCQGQESSVTQCQHSPWYVHDCLPTELAAVTCFHLNLTVPQPPTPKLECREGDILALFNKSDDPYLEPKHLHIYPSDCADLVVTDTDPLYIAARIPYDKCGTNVTQNASHIIYSNTIFVERTSHEGYIYRSSEYTVGLRCLMERWYNVSKPAELLTQSVTQSVIARFSVQLKIYQDQYFEREVPSYPHRLVVGEWLNYAVELETADPRLVLVVHDCCVRANNSNSQHTPQRDIFVDKCIAEYSLDVFHISRDKFGFRFQSFAFVHNPLIWIECRAVVCLASEKIQECDRSCNSGKPVTRRRRHVVSGELLESEEDKTVFIVKSESIIVEMANRTPSMTTLTTPRSVATSSGASTATETATTMASTMPPTSTRRPEALAGHSTSTTSSMPASGVSPASNEEHRFQDTAPSHFAVLTQDSLRSMTTTPKLTATEVRKMTDVSVNRTTRTGTMSISEAPVTAATQAMRTDSVTETLRMHTSSASRTTTKEFHRTNSHTETPNTTTEAYRSTTIAAAQRTTTKANRTTSPEAPSATTTETRRSSSLETPKNTEQAHGTSSPIALTVMTTDAHMSLSPEVPRTTTEVNRPSSPEAPKTIATAALKASSPKATRTITTEVLMTSSPESTKTITTEAHRTLSLEVPRTTTKEAHRTTSKSGAPTMTLAEDHRTVTVEIPGKTITLSTKTTSGTSTNTTAEAGMTSTTILNSSTSEALKTSVDAFKITVEAIETAIEAKTTTTRESLGELATTLAGKTTIKEAPGTVPYGYEHVNHVTVESHGLPVIDSLLRPHQDADVGNMHPGPGLSPSPRSTGNVWHVVVCVAWGFWLLAWPV